MKKATKVKAPKKDKPKEKKKSLTQTLKDRKKMLDNL
jgi:hypothetical protein